MKTLVESCFQISTALFKNELQLARGGKTGIGGSFNILQGNTKSVADYRVEIGTEYDYLVIGYGEENQRIRLVESELHFGPRSWFVCDCGRRVSKLYLPANTSLFKCRYCHRLVYELTTFNRKSTHGQFMYQTNRMIKLTNFREGMRSILYDGHYTKRFNRFLTLSDRTGLKSNREDAKVLLSDIRGQLQSF